MAEESRRPFSVIVALKVLQFLTIGLPITPPQLEKHIMRSNKTFNLSVIF